MRLLGVPLGVILAPWPLLAALVLWPSYNAGGFIWDEATTMLAFAAYMVVMLFGRPYHHYLVSTQKTRWFHYLRMGAVLGSVPAVGFVGVLSLHFLTTSPVGKVDVAMESLVIGVALVGLSAMGGWCFWLAMQHNPPQIMESSSAAHRSSLRAALLMYGVVTMLIAFVVLPSISTSSPHNILDSDVNTIRAGLMLTYRGGYEDVNNRAAIDARIIPDRLIEAEASPDKLTHSLGGALHLRPYALPGDRPGTASMFAIELHEVDQEDCIKLVPRLYHNFDAITVQDFVVHDPEGILGKPVEFEGSRVVAACSLPLNQVSIYGK